MKLSLPAFLAVTGLLTESTDAQQQPRALSTEESKSMSMEIGFMHLIDGGGGTGGTAKSGKGGKGGKGAKCEQDDFLVARYGSQICPSEIQAKFTRVKGGKIHTYGLQTFLKPGFSVPVTDNFRTGGQVALTLEQVESICITKCEKNPNCEAVSVLGYNQVSDKATEPQNPDYECTMVKPGLGPGAYLEIIPEGFLNTVTFLKKSGTPLPSFDDVKCDVDVTEIEYAIQCRLFGINDEECKSLLTSDWVTHIAPAIDCVKAQGKAAAQGDPNADPNAGPYAVLDCFACLSGVPNLTIEKICPISAESANVTDRCGNGPKVGNGPNVVRGFCGEQCFSDVCESQVSTAMMCVLGSPYALVAGFDGGSKPSFVNGGPANFTCPSVE